MHYHIFWGLRSAEAPSILNYANKLEAIDRFIDLVKEIEGESVKDFAPPWEEVQMDKNTFMIRMETIQYRYCLVYCQNDCDLSLIHI